MLPTHSPLQRTAQARFSDKDLNACVAWLRKNGLEIECRGLGGCLTHCRVENAILEGLIDYNAVTGNWHAFFWPKKHAFPGET